MSRASLTNLVAGNILTGGRRTTATNERSLWSAIIAEAVNKGDDLNALNGYLGISASGLVDISFIKSGAPSGKFLKDDGTWADAGSGSTPGLGAVVAVSGVLGFGDVISNTDNSGQFQLAEHSTNFYHAEQIFFQSLKYNFDGLTVSRFAYIDVDGNLKSTTAVTTELEFGYVAGATSNLQNQINNINAGLSWKPTSRVATTANITLSGAQTIDGVSVVAGDRVLVKNQSTGSQNGIYVAAAGAWTRATDADTGVKILQATLGVEEGTANGDTIYTCTTNGPITINVTALVFAKTSATTYTGSDGVTLTGNNFALDNSYFSGDVTVSAGVTAIGALKVTNAMLAGSIAWSKLTSTPTTMSGYGITDGMSTALTSAYILVGNGSNVATGVAVSGDITINNTGVTAIGALKVTNAMLAGSIAWSKLTSTPTTMSGYGITDGMSTALTSAYILVGNGSNVATGVAMSGDITINNTGVTAIGGLKVTNAMIANGTIDLLTKVTGVLPTANGGMDTATYETIMVGAGMLNTSTVTANTYYLIVGPGSINTCTSGTANAFTPAAIYIDSSDYPTVNGKVAKLRIRANMFVNATGYTGSITFGLFPLTAPGSAGGASTVSHTIGTVVTGSNGATQTNPTANTNYNLTGSDFALPANGWYVIAATTTGTLGTATAIKITASLQIHNP